VKKWVISLTVAAVGVLGAVGVGHLWASSHREAPLISEDPVADNTDVYAFVSPDKPDTVTIVANWIPLEEPAGGPNFYKFGDEVLYELNIDNDGDARDDIVYQFRLKTDVQNEDTFLYNTGPITSLSSPNWNSKQFYVDLGAIFDLGDLRPFQHLNAFHKMADAHGVNATNRLNVHTIAIQIPISQVTRPGHHTIGVWTSAERQRARISNGEGAGHRHHGPFTQVSRLGNPLFNEVIVPIGAKDRWNRLAPQWDKQFAKYVAHPELAKLLPVLYPGVFPHLAALNASGKKRADLEAILLTGIPAGIVPHFSNFTGPVPADMLRLNTKIKPSHKPNILGVLGGDLAGFPNGRRIVDDVVSIELRAIAGLTVPLVDPKYKPDPAAGALTDGLTGSSVKNGPLSHFPYMGVPYDGFHNP